VGKIVSRLRVILDARTDQFEKKLGGSQKVLKGWQKEAKAGFKSVGRAATGLTAQLGIAAGVLGLGAMVKSSLNSIDAQAKFADKIGVSTLALGGLHHAAELTGVSTRDMNLGLQRMTRRVAEAARGTGAAQKAIKELGLDAKRLASLRPDEQFRAIAESMSEVGSRSDQVRLAFAVFDAGGVGLLNTMDAGAEGIKKMQNEAVLLGSAVSRIDAAKIEAANDALFRSSQVFKGFANQLTVGLAPFIESAAKEFVGLAGQNGGMAISFVNGIETVAKSVAFLADVWHGLKVVVKGVEVVVSGVLSAIVTMVDWVNRAFWAMINGIVQGFINYITLPIRLLAPFNDQAAKMLEKVEAFKDASRKMYEPSKAMTDIAQEARNATAGLVDQMGVMAMQETNLKKVERVVKSIKDNVQKTAEETARLKNNQAGGSSGSAGFEPNAAELALAEKKQQKIQADLMALEQSLMTERDLISLHYSEQLLQVEGLMDSKAITLEQRNGFIEQLTTKHEDKLTQLANKGASDRAKFEAMTAGQKTKSVLGQMISLTAGVAQENRTMFEVNKAAATANAIVNTHKGVSVAWGMGPILGPVMAGITLAAGLAQVNAIQSTSFGGGGSAPSVSGGGGGGASTVNTLPATPSAAANIQPVAESRANESQRSQGLTIYVQAENLYGQEDFANAVADAVKEADGRDIQMFVPGSRNLGMANA